MLGKVLGGLLFSHYIEIITDGSLLCRCRFVSAGHCVEFRELLDRLFSWCDLCLPANEQAFAESHRQKIQKFQVQIVQEMKRSNNARSQVPCKSPTGRNPFEIATEGR